MTEVRVAAQAGPFIVVIGSSQPQLWYETLSLEISSFE